MYYEINVSLNGYHFFATDKRSIMSLNELKKVLPAIKARFLESDGFKIDVYFYQLIGETVDQSSL